MCIVKREGMEKPEQKIFYKVLIEYDDGELATPYVLEPVARKGANKPNWRRETCGGYSIPHEHIGTWSVCTTLEGALMILISRTRDGQKVTVVHPKLRKDCFMEQATVKIFEVEADNIVRWGVWSGSDDVEECLVREFSIIREIKKVMFDDSDHVIREDDMAPVEAEAKEPELVGVR